MDWGGGVDEVADGEEVGRVEDGRVDEILGQQSSGYDSEMGFSGHEDRMRGDSRL